MMSSHSIQSHVEPLYGGKMPLVDRPLLPKPKAMSDLRSKKTLQYGEPCFPCDRREKEVAGFTPPWTNLKASLLDVRNPVSHLSGMGGQNHIIYRQDSSSSEEGHSSSLHHAAVKKGFTLYTNSSGMSSPAAATSVSGRKHKNGGESLSPSSENTVYLAIPKPVYGLNPCCRDLGCVIGHRYGVEHDSARIPSAAYEHEWLQNDASYTERRKAQDALLQQRGLQFEPSAEALKRISVGTYSPGRVRTFPAVIDPNYAYPFALPHTLFGSLREQSQRLQTSPRGYPSFYPSHPTYEHMTSEVYQEHSPMSKYGRLTQHPMFYYPQANVEVENRTQYKDICSKQREEVPVILKNSISNHREHYMVPQLLHGEIPRPLSEETLHNHSFMRGSDHQAFAPPGFHSNSAQIRQLLSSSRINVSPQKTYVHHPGTSAANLHKDKLSPGPSQTHSPFRHVDQTSPPRRTIQPGISPSSVPVNRFIPPLTSLHLHRPILPPAALHSDKLRDHSSFESQVTCPRQARGVLVPPGVWLPQSPPHSSGRIHAPLPGSANVPKIIYSPAVTPEKKEKHPMPSPSSAVPKGCLKRSFSHSSPPTKIKEEDRELCEVDLTRKRQKMKMESVREKNENYPPLMPVIDNVFSLASYQAYLQAPGLLFPGRVSQRIPQQPEHREVKCRPDIKEKKPSQDEQQPVVCLVSKEARAESRKRSVETFELKTIKVEKVDPSDRNNSADACVSPRDRRRVTIKKEPEDVRSSNREPILVIKKVNSDKLEGRPSQEEHTETSDESNQSKVTAQIKTSDQGDASKMQEQVVTIQPTPNTSPQLDNGDKFKNIPPQCLKLSNYKIVFHSTNHSSPVLPPQKLAPQPMTDIVPKSEPQIPVRKHFFEMHQSLCKLISKSVLASSTQDLKAWLSQLDLSRPASPPTKVKKVSCLFGKKAREAWLNDDMKLALHKLLERLREYMAQERCPFPHVMRTGAVFLPMLVVKELLFPTVQGTFIDQVLQEHKVELRPTTLSEEKILIQLHKRACSSRLRRLMSLKHLPDIYADVVSLMYYTCVCTHLGLDLVNPANREKDEETISCRTPMLSDIMASPASPTESQRQPNDQEVNKKGRVKTSSRRMFLDSSLSDEEEADGTEQTVRGGDFNPAAELESSVSISSENSWMCPLTLDELSSCPSDAEIDQSSIPDTQYSPPAKSVARSKRYSGMVLKLRRTFSKDRNRNVACYQAISDSGTLVDPTQTDDMNSELELHRQTPKRWQRTGKFCHALRPLSSSKRRRSPLLKIKYCPYLSTCHSAEHRRQWVLRSAVQRAHRAMKFYYPDLVGKRIRHLYEEDDKSEVWYRGEVLRIHKAHTNPLKTIFEVRYDSEPEWKYYLELLIDYKKGWLKIEDKSTHVNI